MQENFEECVLFSSKFSNRIQAIVISPTIENKATIYKTYA